MNLTFLDGFFAPFLFKAGVLRNSKEKILENKSTSVELVSKLA